MKRKRSSKLFECIPLQVFTATVLSVSLFHCLSPPNTLRIGIRDRHNWIYWSLCLACCTGCRHEHHLVWQCLSSSTRQPK